MKSYFGEILNLVNGSKTASIISDVEIILTSDNNINIINYQT